MQSTIKLAQIKALAENTSNQIIKLANTSNHFGQSSNEHKILNTYQQSMVQVFLIFFHLKLTMHITKVVCSWQLKFKQHASRAEVYYACTK
jgi:hypothetical protein